VGYFKIIPSIESATGLLHCVDTATASSRLVALAFGAEDYTASMEIDRTKTGKSSSTRAPWSPGRPRRRVCRSSTRFS